MSNHAPSYKRRESAFAPGTDNEEAGDEGGDAPHRGSVSVFASCRRRSVSGFAPGVGVTTSRRTDEYREVSQKSTLEPVVPKSPSQVSVGNPIDAKTPLLKQLVDTNALPSLAYVLPTTQTYIYIYVYIYQVCIKKVI